MVFWGLREPLALRGEGVKNGRKDITVGVEYQRSGLRSTRPSAERSQGPQEHHQPGWARRRAVRLWQEDCKGGRPWPGGVVLGFVVMFFLVVRLCGREAWCCGLSLAGIF